MRNEPPKVKVVAQCTDARYEEDTQSLMLFCDLHDPINAKRVIVFEKSNFHQTLPDGSIRPVPDEEMHKTAELWKGKPWNFEMDNDPNRDVGEGGDPSEGMSPSEYQLHEKIFMGEVGGRMLKMTEEMSSDEHILQSKRENLLKKEKDIQRKMRG